MGKVIQLKRRRPPLRLEPRVHGDECPKCRHKMNVHITHPNGTVSCAARGCRCERRPPQQLH